MIVIDDVWDPNHLRPFLRGGSQCARLITTRQLTVTTEINAARTVVDRMTEEQGIALLASRIQSQPVQHEELGTLASRLGGWPLLLKLAGSQLRERMERGDSLQGAVDYLNRAMDKKGTVAFDRASPTERSDAVASTVGASLEPFSQVEQQRCAELSVFRQDVPFPLGAVSILWDLEEFDAEDLLLRLDNAALLDFDLKTGGIQIHRVLRSYMQSRLENIIDLHSRLIEKWLRNPYNLPDTYAWMWIGWHLVQGDNAEVLTQRLLDYDWLSARLDAIPILAVLQDFDLLEETQDTRVVRDALRLASHGLSFDPRQLSVQLKGRIDRGHSLAIDALLENADASEIRPRLIIADTSLTHPGGALTGIVKTHGGSVEAIAVSPDGRWFVSGSQDWKLRLWDLHSGSVKRIFEGHAGTVHAIAFTPDGKSIISGSEDRTLRIWDVSSGRQKQILRGHTLAVQGLAISVDGKTAASVSEDGTVRQWDLIGGKSKVVYKGRDHQLNTVAITADSGTLYFGAGDWTIRRLDLSGENEEVLEGHSGIVRSLVLTTAEDRLLSGADDGTIRVWSLKTDECIQKLKGHTGSVDAVAVTLDGKLGVSGSRDNSVRVWDLLTGTERNMLEGHSGFVKAIATSPSTGQVLSGSTDQTIRYWTIDTTLRRSARSGHSGPVSLLALSSDGNTAISGTRAGELTLWGIQALEVVEGVESLDKTVFRAKATGHLDGHTDRIHSLQMTADGKRAITGSRDRTLRVWDVERRTCEQVLRGHTREVLALDISGDGQRVVSLSRDRTLRTWDIKTGGNLRVLVCKSDERALSALQVDDPMLAELDTGPRIDTVAKPISKGQRIALSPDGNRVVIASQGYVAVWDLETGSSQELSVEDLDISIIAFDPKSTNCVLGSLFGPLLIWDFVSAPTLLEGHSGMVLDLVVKQDGATAISGGEDDTIRFWDLLQRTQIARIDGLLGKVDAIVIAPDGHLAYAVYGDTVVAYDLDLSRRNASLSVDHQISAISVTPSGAHLVIGDQSGQVHHLCLQS